MSYYTPSIEEFHVGFEYEFVYDTDGSGITYWRKELCTCKNIKENVTSIYPYDTLESTCIRVKYLDREDIESLGFKFERNGVTVSEDYPQHFNMEFSLEDIKLTYLNWFVGNSTDYTEHRNLMISRTHADDKYKQLFVGNIKNISELKRLLKQLGINE